VPPLPGSAADAAGRIVEAHGVGGAKDLPLPLGLTVAGATAALAVSFIVLALAWRTPRYDGVARGRPVPRLQRVVDSTAATVAARALGLLVLGWALMAAVAGQDLLVNPFFGMFYVLLWVGVVPLSLLLGPFYRAVSPVRTLSVVLARAVGTDPREGILRYPERLGRWPAALGLFAFVWLELVSPAASDLAAVRLWFAGYVAVVLVGGAVFGTRFHENADPFEVYSTLVGHLSPWGRQDGTLVVRSPLANLATVPPAPGLVAVVAVLLGSTAFDSVSSSSWWVSFTQARASAAYLLDNLALLGLCVLVGGLFAGACMLTGVGPGTSRRRLPALFAHSVVPIVVGYVVAHYLTYLVEQGQLTIIQMSDPLSRGDDLLGTGDWAVGYWLSYHPTFLAVVKVLGVVVGHVVAVVAAHDRAIALLPRRSQLTGQLPLLAVMVVFTVGGLSLLFAA
jgi:hypothetical protein